MLPEWPSRRLRDHDPVAYAESYRRTFMNRALGDLRLDDPLHHRTLEESDAVLRSWPTAGGLGRHLELSIAAAFRRRSRGLPPLEEGQPVPGCKCEACTGRTPLPRRRRRSRRATPYLDVVGAREASILDVACRLGLGRPVRRGRELVVCCPLHDDRRPSLRLDPRRNLWYCDPCAEGGDAILLVQRVLRCDFAAAVRELAGVG